MPAETGLPLGQRGTQAGATGRNAIAFAIAVLAFVMFLPGLHRLDPRGKAAPALLTAAEANPGSPLHLIVREAKLASRDAERLIARLGGSVTHDLPMVGGLAVDLPGAALTRLLGSPAVAHVWPPAATASVSPCRYS